MSASGLLTRAWFPLRYHPLQSEAWRTRKRFVCLPCGRGSGKTELARRRIVRCLPIKKPWEDPLYFYALPTYMQARRVAWKKIKQLVPPEWVAPNGIHETTMQIETIFGSSLYVVGMDKPQRVEGDQWDGGVLDESCDQKPGVFDLNVRPALSHRNGWCWRIGVPKRYGSGARDFREFCELGLSGDDEIATYSWPSSDILSEKEIANARRILDPRDFAEQYGGSWEDVGGRCHWAFDEVLNVDARVSYDSSRPIVVGSDFNVDPMAWVIGHRYREKPGKLIVFDEIWRRNTNTRRTLDELYERYGRHDAGWEFFGDASASARRTSASESDYIQIRNDKRFGKARVFYPPSNPRVVDRFAACNAMFCNANDERRLFIHPRCENLIRDLESRAFKAGSREPDDYGDVGHISDALGYVVHRCWPVSLYESESSSEVIIAGGER